METVTERLAEVHTPTLILCVCLYLSNPAVDFSSSLEQGKMPAGFYSKPTNRESKAKHVWLIDSSPHLLSSPVSSRSLLFFFLQIKLQSSFSVSAPCRPRVLIHSAPGVVCVLFIKQKNQPGSAVCLPLQVSAVRCTFFSNFHLLWKIYTGIHSQATLWGTPVWLLVNANI